MKKITYSSAFLIVILFFMAPVTTQAQVDKNAAALKKLETGITVAKGNVAKNEKIITTADSLITAGTTMINESKTETKSITADRKILDKEYATGRKSLEKLSVSKDKAEATKAKADLKALDIKYKADTKNLDNRLKLATKNSTTGTANLSKGKTSKKTAQDALKTALAALDAAQAKYDAVANPGEKSEADKKKRK
jgi:hypothetical protein